MEVQGDKGVFNSPHTHITESFNVYQQKSPPADHPNAVVCVQCDGLTWRMTDCCIHCNFDIAAYNQEQLRLSSIEELRCEYQRLRRKALPLLLSVFACAIGLLLTITLASKAFVVYWIIIGIMLILVAFIKPIDAKMVDIRKQIHELESY